MNPSKTTSAALAALWQTTIKWTPITWLKMRTVHPDFNCLVVGRVTIIFVEDMTTREITATRSVTVK